MTNEEDEILASLSDDAITMLKEFPGIWDAAELFPRIAELQSAGLIEEATLPDSDRLTRVHTELGKKVLERLKSKEKPKEKLPVSDIMWRKEKKQREGLEETLGRVAYLLEEVGLAWDEVRRELTARDQYNINEAIDSHRRENES